MVGGDGLWNVHVHVDDVGAAVEAGIEAGRPHRVRVTHFAEQLDRARAGAERCARAARSSRSRPAPGSGTLFVQAGATVVPGGPGRRPSTGQILEAIRGAGAAEVIVLPNDRDSIAAAEAAARTARGDGDIRVAVIPTDAQVQGLAALAVHEPGRTFEQDILEMTAAARHARSGAVTVAARQAMTTAGPCEPGDVLGVDRGRLRGGRRRPVRRGHRGRRAAARRWRRAGHRWWPARTAGDLAERCAAHLERRPPDRRRASSTTAASSATRCSIGVE